MNGDGCNKYCNVEENWICVGESCYNLSDAPEIEIVYNTRLNNKYFFTACTSQKVYWNNFKDYLKIEFSFPVEYDLEVNWHEEAYVDTIKFSIDINSNIIRDLLVSFWIAEEN